MKSTSFLALAAEYLEAQSSDIRPSPLSKSIRFASNPCGKDKPTESCPASQFLGTCASSTGERGTALPMLSPGASPAPTSAISEAGASDLGSPGNAPACGPKCAESLKKLGQPSPSSRTLRKSDTGDSTASFKTLPPSGLIVRGEFIPLPKSVRRTKENASGVWLGTPTAHMHVRSIRFRAKTPNLSEMVGGRLKANPEYLEWQMGWPIGWTDLLPLGTARFRAWLYAHGVGL